MTPNPAPSSPVSPGPAAGRLRLDAITAQPIGLEFKSFPAPSDDAGPVAVAAAGQQGWNALRPPFATPVLVLKDRAVRHNIDLMAAYCAARGVSLAPHAKTPLAPQLADRQLAAGAWALTVADVHQARVLRAAGAARLLIANEVTDGASLSWIAGQLDAEPPLDLYCLVDSAAGAVLLDRHLAAAGARRPLPVLLELGIPGARCGCRTVAQALDVAAQVAALPRLRLAGAEAYENLFPPGSAEQTSGQVDQLLAGLRELVVTLDRRGLFGLAPESQAPEGRAPEGQAPEIRAPEIIVSAGGSMWFDRAAADLAGPWPLSRPVRTVVRAGAYLTHDFDEYERFSPLAGRSDGPPRPGQALEQALELWSAVLSRPEPGLAILNFGKRDAGLDRSLPLPFAARPGGRPAELPAGEYEVLSLNDQHARLRLPVDSPLAVGDLVGCYISHPCTTFDRWRLMPLVTDGYDVIGAVRSYL